MAYQSEIEKLERRYQENPDQWFAALADQYRKTGSMELALQVVKAGLEKRPNYVSGHIVLGRCLLDEKKDAEAHAVFERVLELDAENIMALKTLAEIALRTADVEGERKWLSRLLEIDPMNDDARDAMAKLPALVVEEPVAAVEAHAPAESGLLGGFEATSFADIAPPEPAAAAPEPEPEPVAEAAAEALPEPMALPEPEPAMMIERSGGEEPAPEAEMALELDQGGPELVSMEEQPAHAGTRVSQELEQSDLAVELDAPVIAEAPADTSRLIPLDATLVGGEGGMSLELTSAGIEPDSVVELTSARAEPDPFSGLPSADETAALPGGSEPEPVVTETMAELYAKQGLLQEARAVYQQLIAARPNDAKLRRRLQELEPQGSGPARRRRPTAATTGGLSARAYIAGVLSGQPMKLATSAKGAQPSAMDTAFAHEPPGGAPTMPAPDEVSLSSVFPDEAAAGPARQAEGGSGGGGGAFSFDEFFGGRRPARPSAPRTSTGGPGGEDDFKSWLKDLKT